jgi:2-haloacid dehalogenase
MAGEAPGHAVGRNGRIAMDPMKRSRRSPRKHDPLASLKRRAVPQSMASLATVPALAARAPRAFGQSAPAPLQDSVKALVFDVFGTVVDWRSGVAREAQAVLEPLGHSLDWLAFADAWRAQYQPGMEEVRTGKIEFVKLDVIHRRMLDRIVPQFGLEKLDPKVLDELTLAWHRLDAWKDVAPGFARLRRRFLMAPCSNANIAIMVDIARRNDIRWDAILGSEIAGDFKPKPRVYLAAAEALDIKPGECMMTAAHSNDLASAAKYGLRTAHVARPGERGPGSGETEPRVPVDVAARNFEDLADKLGA